MTRPTFTDRATVRTTRVGVRLSDNERDALDAQREDGEGRATCLRRLAGLDQSGDEDETLSS